MNKQTHVLITMLLLTLFLATSSGVSADVEPTIRVALVASQSNDAVERVLTLSTAKLSNIDGIVLLERQEIRRVLEEHRLSLSGLVDADQAITLGNLKRLGPTYLTKPFKVMGTCLGLSFDRRRNVERSIAKLKLGGGLNTLIPTDVHTFLHDHVSFREL